MGGVRPPRKLGAVYMALLKAEVVWSSIDRYHWPLRFSRTLVAGGRIYNPSPETNSKQKPLKNGPNSAPKGKRESIHSNHPFSGVFTCYIVSGFGYFFCGWKKFGGTQAASRWPSSPSSRPWIQLTSEDVFEKQKPLEESNNFFLDCQDAA